MMRRIVLVVAALVVLSLTACSDDGPGPGEARLQLDGEAAIERADGDREVVTGSSDLRDGDRVSIIEGRGELLLPGGTRLELRDGVGDAAATSVVVGEVPVLEAGELLVAAPESIVVAVDGTDVTVVEGVARLQRDFGMAVASYDAAVSLDSAGVARDVPALRQMAVPALGRPPQLPRPLAVDESDPWDRRLLGAAIELGNQLDTLATGLTDNLPEGGGRTPGFFRLVLPGLDDEADFTADLLDLDRAPSETLIGAAITDLGQRGQFLSRWNEVFEFRDAGAAWGIVALDQAVRSAPLVGTVEEALSAALADATFALPPGSTPATPAPPPTTAPADPLDPPVGEPPSSGTPPPTTAPPPPPPTTTPEPEPLAPPLLDPLVEPVTGLLGDLVEGLLGG